MNKYLTEFIGTFFLSVTLLLSTAGKFSAMSPLATGAILIGMTGMGLAISGAHFNPVVSLALLLRGKMERTDILYYIIAQTLGAVLAGTIAVFLLESGRHSTAHIEARQNEMLPATLVELLGAFAWTMAAIYTISKNEKTVASILPVGMTVLALSVAFHDLSGAFFNPAVAIASMIAGMAFWADFPLYFIAPLLGAGAASSVYFFMEKAGREEI